LAEDVAPLSVHQSLLRAMLPVLAKRRIAEHWATSSTPEDDLACECRAIANDSESLGLFTSYLRDRQIIQRSIYSFLAHIGVAMLPRKEIVFPSEIAKKMSPDFSFEGYCLSWWLPTFLVLDGPLGQILRDSQSPLNLILRTHASTYPILADVRKAFNKPLFRELRNGVAHWAFVFEPDIDGIHRLVCFDLSGKKTVEVSIFEADALARLSLCTIKCLDQYVFYPANPGAYKMLWTDEAEGSNVERRPPKVSSEAREIAARMIDCGFLTVDSDGTARITVEPHPTWK
jgi:hypothetical protein